MKHFIHLKEVPQEILRETEIVFDKSGVDLQLESMNREVGIKGSITVNQEVPSIEGLRDLELGIKYDLENEKQFKNVGRFTDILVHAFIWNTAKQIFENYIIEKWVD
jgi:hypothetical protein